MAYLMRSRLTWKTPERRQLTTLLFFIVNFEQIQYNVQYINLAFSFLTLNLKTSLLHVCVIAVKFLSLAQ